MTGFIMDIKIKNKILSCAIFSGMVFILALIYAINPASGKSPFPPCVIYKLTGLFCAGCGATRALHEVLHFRFYEAFMLNPLFIILLPLITYIIISYLVNLFFSKKILPKIKVNAACGYGAVFVIIFYSLLRYFFGF